MLEELDLGDMAPSGGPTPQPSTVWSRGAHAHSHAHAHDPDHDVDGTDDEGTPLSWLVSNCQVPSIKRASIVSV